MNDFYDEVNLLVKNIINHNLDARQVRINIDQLKKKYGEDAFSSINFQKKPQPWDKHYLMELKEKNVTGANSEEFLLHMADVSDYISVRKKRLFTVILFAGAIIVIIALLIIIF